MSPPHSFKCRRYAELKLRFNCDAFVIVTFEFMVLKIIEDEHQIKRGELN